MHTTITRQLTLNQACFIFNDTDNINIRMFELKEEYPQDRNVAVKYELLIRHNEEDSPYTHLKNSLHSFKLCNEFIKHYHRQGEIETILSENKISGDTKASLKNEYKTLANKMNKLTPKIAEVQYLHAIEEHLCMDYEEDFLSEWDNIPTL